MMRGRFNTDPQLLRRATWSWQRTAILAWWARHLWSNPFR